MRFYLAYQIGEPVYQNDSRFKTPDDTSMIWRYMNYDRFKFLVKEQKLYFCSVDTIKRDDPYEGSYYACDLLNEVDPSIAQNFVKQANSCGPSIAVNCWHLSKSESMAMWKLYSGDKGIAIQTTVGKLKVAFDGFKDIVYIGEIVYTDEPIEHPNGWTVDMFMSCMTKRKCFEHEKELRAFIWNTTKQVTREKDGSVIVPIKVNSLAEKVYLSPTSKGCLRAKVNALMKKNNIINIPIIPSRILTAPCF